MLNKKHIRNSKNHVKNENNSNNCNFSVLNKSADNEISEMNFASRCSFGFFVYKPRTFVKLIKGDLR